MTFEKTPPSLLVPTSYKYTLHKSLPRKIDSDAASNERQSLLEVDRTNSSPQPELLPVVVFEVDYSNNTGIHYNHSHHSTSVQWLSTYGSCVDEPSSHHSQRMTDSSSNAHIVQPPPSPPKWWNNYEEWNMLLRELRHNPCFMRPITTVVILIIAISWSVMTVLRLPTMVLGILLAPLLNKFYWVVEFWYPTGLGKQLHFWMIRLSGGGNRKRNSGDANIDANRGYHSRCIETRIELIPQRVYIHPLPQFMDNLGYVVICLPPPPLSLATAATSAAASTPNGSIPQSKEVTSHGSTLYIDPHANANDMDDGSTNIVALVVDCGDAKVVLQQIDMIRELFYNNSPIHVQSILSTHKHHDHTAGNIELMNTLKSNARSISNGSDNASGVCGPVRLIFGGAADKVPGCNYPLANGDFLPLPKAGMNDMNDCIEIEAIATPAHTRGSIAYLVRPKVISTVSNSVASSDVCLFTGDTIFSAGGGVPFEADTDTTQEESASKMTANNYIKASAATYAVERCFAEVLYRTVPIVSPSSNSGSNGMVMSPLSTTTTSTTSSKTSSLDASIRDHVIILPGHEYSQELLARQLSPSSSSSSPLSPNKWKNFEPSYFFQTASQYFIALHRRTNLPISSSGTLLLIPTTLSRELYINPHLRSLRQRGKTIIIALKLWNRYFAKVKVIQDNIECGPAFSTDQNDNTSNTSKTRAKEDQWNLNSADLNEPVFTTVYASDLDTIINELSSGQIDTTTAAIKLSTLKLALEHPVVGRRAIPGTLPSSRAVYRGLVALTLLASAPTALTRSDSHAMKLPEPITHSTSTDHVSISKRRLICVLFCLGLLDDSDGKFIVAIIEQLWKEVRDVTTIDWKPELSRSSAKVNNDILEQRKDDIENNSTDAESMPETQFDECELGALKWVIYGIPAQQKSKSFFTKYCLPCSKHDDSDLPTNTTHTSTKMKRHGGELVRHDVFTCKLCRNATGCPQQQIYLNQIEENDNGYMHQIMTVGTTADQRQDEDCHDNMHDDDESTTFIEVSPNAISSIPGI